MSAEKDALSATETAKFFGLSLKMRRRQAHNGVSRQRKRGGAGFPARPNERNGCSAAAPR